MTRSTLRARGQVTLPQEVREALGIEDGDEIEFDVIGPGEVVIRGLRLIPADQAWFWTDSWQRGEREVDEDLAAGRYEVITDDKLLLKAFDA